MHVKSNEKEKHTDLGIIVTVNLLEASNELPGNFGEVLKPLKQKKKKKIEDDI